MKRDSLRTGAVYHNGKGVARKLTMVLGPTAPGKQETARYVVVESSDPKTPVGYEGSIVMGLFASWAKGLWRPKR